MAISDDIRGRIIGMSEGGSTQVQIAATIKVSVKTIKRLVKFFRDDGTYKHEPSLPIISCIRLKFHV